MGIRRRIYRRLTSLLGGGDTTPSGPIPAPPPAPDPVMAGGEAVQHIDWSNPSLRAAIASAASGFAADSFSNSWTGQGDEAKDKIQQVRPKMEPYLERYGQDFGAVSGLTMRRVVVAPADAVTAKTPRVDDNGQRDVAADTDIVGDRYNIHHKMAELMRTDRIREGAALWPVIRGVDLTKPLPPGPHEVRAVHVLTSNDLRDMEWERDPEDPLWLRPSMWQAQVIREGISSPPFNIHGSHLIMMNGLWLPADFQEQRARRAFGLSVTDAYWPIMRAIYILLDAVTRAGMEHSTPRLTLGDRSPTQGSLRASAQEAIREMQRARSMMGITVLQKGDTLDRDNVSLSGLRELLSVAYELFASIEGMPLTWAFGQAPSGFSTDDASGQRNLHEFFGRLRSHKLLPAYQQWHDITLGPSATRRYHWPPWDESSGLERAQEYSAWLDGHTKAVQLGVFTVADVQKTFAHGEIGGVPSIGEDELEERIAESEVDGGEEVTAEDLANIAALAASGQRGTQEQPMADEPVAPDDDEASADAATYQAPASARNNARKVLRWREEHGDAVQGMTPVGWTRANQLAKGEALSRETVGRMAAFARHRKNAAVDPKFKDEPWRDAGYVAWLGWGGTSGIEWAAGIVSQTSGDALDLPRWYAEQVREFGADAAAKAMQAREPDPDLRAAAVTIAESLYLVS